MEASYSDFKTAMLFVLVCGLTPLLLGFVLGGCAGTQSPTTDEDINFTGQLSGHADQYVLLNTINRVERIDLELFALSDGSTISCPAELNAVILAETDPEGPEAADGSDPENPCPRLSIDLDPGASLVVTVESIDGKEGLRYSLAVRFK